MFIDFSNAYDTIDRQRLNVILKEKNILNDEEIQLINFIHKYLEIGFEDNTVTTTTGLPQGLKTSPLLFNIYSETLIAELIHREVKTWFYADDIVCLVEGVTGVRRATSVV